MANERFAGDPHSDLPTRVLFLDFDGVLNSESSFRLELSKGTKHVADTLSEIACSNLQRVLKKCPDLRIVISSTWRLMHDMAYLKAKLYHYGVDQTRVIDVTPQTFSGHRGREIGLWLEDNPQVTQFIVVDDDPEAHIFRHDKRALSVETTWEDGLLYRQAKEAIAFLSKRPPGSEGSHLSL